MSAQKQNTILVLILAAILSLANPMVLRAGNPIVVTKTGQPYRWDVNNPITIHPEAGGLGKYSNSEAIAQILGPALDAWAGVSTAQVRWNVSKAISTDIQTVQDVQLAVDRGYNPIVFDQGGRILTALGIPTQSVLAVTSVGGNSTNLMQGYIIINGLWIDGNSSNGEVTRDEMIDILIHELGHFLGLGHSQVNGHMFLNDKNTDDPSYRTFGPPPAEAPVEVMFPYMISGVSKPRLSRDDQVAISSLYPAQSFQTYGSISGHIYLADGKTPFQGANVVARNAANPYFDAVAVVSGGRYIDSDGRGSNDLQFKGLYEIGGLEPGASYLVEMTNLVQVPDAGSRIGPLCPHAKLPGPEEFYNGSREGASDPPDNPLDFVPVQVLSGKTATDTDIIINGTPPTLTAIPSTCTIPSGGSRCSVDIVGTNPNRWPVQVWVQGPGDSQAHTMTGTTTESGFTLRFDYVFEGTTTFYLYDFSGSVMQLLAKAGVRGIKTDPGIESLTVNPLTCTISSGGRRCTVTVVVNNSNRWPVQVWVKGPSDTQAHVMTGVITEVTVSLSFDWVFVGTTTFYLYDVSGPEKQLLATATAKGIPSGPPAPATLVASPPTCTIPSGSDRCSVNVLGKNPNMRPVQVWVRGPNEYFARSMTGTMLDSDFSLRFDWVFIGTVTFYLYEITDGGKYCLAIATATGRQSDY